MTNSVGGWFRCIIIQYDSIMGQFLCLMTSLFDLCLMCSMQKQLEDSEIIPLARIIFRYFADAATYGKEQNDCDLIYSRCPYDLEHFVKKRGSSFSLKKFASSFTSSSSSSSPPSTTTESSLNSISDSKKTK